MLGVEGKSPVFTACAILQEIMNIAGRINLTDRVKEQLPAELCGFIKAAGEEANRQQQKLYMVGGVVRDLLLERVNLDIDLVVEGDAIKLAEEITRINHAKVIPHPRFGTAKIQWGKRNIDVATARAETYASPGALPTVKPGTIIDDLARRDFTINTMAIELNPRHFGQLIDLHGGRNDLKQRLIRVLHEKSFIDDATRIWRAVRYEQRLDFNIEPSTLLLLNRDIDRLDTISGDRIRRELELVLSEELPEKSLRRADELGVLARLHPSLKGDDWLAETFARALEMCQPDSPHPQLYLALLFYRLTLKEAENLISYLHLPGMSSQVIRDTMAVKDSMEALLVHGLPPSQVYHILHGYSLTALTACSIATGSPAAAEHIELYLNVLRHVNPVLSGGDLKKMGIPEGPRIKEILQTLREARLDGKINSRREEEMMVRRFSNHP
jgi:tRNA nucleotidyltransferase (CCA-adding enzyme)